MSDQRTAVERTIRERRSIGRVSQRPVRREVVSELIDAAIWAPNHHLTTPWRFVALAGAARAEVGSAHARALARAKPEHPPAGLAKEAALLERAPVVIACCLAGCDDPRQALEDRDTVAAGIQNLLLAAHARGLGAIWRTGAMPDEPEVRDALGLGDTDAIVGMVYLGHPSGEAPPAPARPAIDQVTVWRGW